MQIDSPIGPLKIREYDNQIMLPMYMGRTKKDPKYDFLIGTDIVTIPPEEAIPPVEEIKKARGE